MNDNNETPKKIMLLNGEAIVREPLEGGAYKLNLVGLPDSPFRVMIDRCNAGTATNDDYAALEALPVFDADVEPEGLEIVPMIGRMQQRRH